MSKDKDLKQAEVVEDDANAQPFNDVLPEEVPEENFGFDEMPAEAKIEQAFEALYYAAQLIKGAGARHNMFFIEITGILRRRYPSKIPLINELKSLKDFAHISDLKESSAELAAANEERTYTGYSQGLPDHHKKKAVAEQLNEQENEQVIQGTPEDDDQGETIDVNVTAEMNTEDFVKEFGDLKTLKEWLRTEGGQTVPNNMRAEQAVALAKRVLFN